MSQRLDGPLISAAELASRIGDPRLRMADVRWYLDDPRRGRVEYAVGHVPGAVFIDLDRDLAASAGRGRHPLPDPAAFADRMGELGFGDDHAIVAYDTANGMVAARLWWMLDRLGHREVAILDGGLAAWMADRRNAHADPAHAPADEPIKKIPSLSAAFAQSTFTFTITQASFTLTFAGTFTITQAFSTLTFA